MKKRDVINATADYTGGGVYIMSGRFASGEWFATDNTVFVELYDSDPFRSEKDYTIDVLDMAALYGYTL